MANKILFEETTKYGERAIEQDGSCLVFHIITKREHKTQVWDISKVKEALAKVESK